LVSVLLLCGFFQPYARADVSVTFPLEGHYRVGRYMPVHVVAGAVGAQAIGLKCDGALPLTIPAQAGALDVTAPWLAISSSLSNATWMDATEHALPISFQPLTDTQHLIGLAGIEASDARAIFPDAELVTIRLDAANPLPGAPAAWEALDGLMLDENAAATVTDNQLRTLLAAGTTVAIRSERKPAGNWPWQRNGVWWVVSHSRTGPPSLVEPAAYGPTYGWVRGVPDATRRRCLLAGVVLAVLLIGTALLRGWRGVAGVGTVAVLASIGWIVWQNRHPPINRLAASVVVNDGPLSQHDRWTWISSPVALDSSFSGEGLVHPIFFTQSMLTNTKMSMVCAGNGQQIEFRFHLEPQLAIAFVSSTMGAESERIFGTKSSFTSMAQDVYSNQSLDVLGEDEIDTGEPTVVCQRRDAGR
jgi:hypothetical protein